MATGIYGIYHGDVCLYIGRSLNLGKRISTHRRHLREGRHSLTPLQEYVNRLDGAVEDLSFATLELLESGIGLGGAELRWFVKEAPLFHGATPSSKDVLGEKGARARESICATCNEEFIHESKGRRIYCSDPCYQEGRKFDCICQECGVTYRVFNKNSKYCSMDCREAKSRIICSCEICGEEFMARRRRRRCGDECATKRWYACLSCGNKFPAATRVRGESVKYCSAECRSGVDSFYELTCERCGEEFIGGKPWARYCTRRCREGRIRTVEKKCISCRKSFSPDDSRIKICSEECRRRRRADNAARRRAAKRAAEISSR